MHQKIATVTLDSPPCSCITCNATIAHMKTHSITVYRWECDQLAAWTGGGLHHRTTRALNEGKHPEVLLPHPQPAHLMLGGKVVRGCWQHCTFNKNKMVHFGTKAQLCKHWSTSAHPSLHPSSTLHCPRCTDSSSRPITSPQSATSSQTSPPRSSVSRHLIRNVNLHTSQRDKG